MTVALGGLVSILAFIVFSFNLSAFRAEAREIIIALNTRNGEPAAPPTGVSVILAAWDDEQKNN